MAESQIASELDQILKPFFERATEAEERLSRLEAMLAAKKGGSDVGDENFSLIVSGTQKLDISTAKTEQATQGLHALTAGNEKQPAGTANLVEENSSLVAANTKLTAENAKILAENTELEAEIAKLKYRIIHLVRALKGADLQPDSQ